LKSFNKYRLKQISETTGKKGFAGDLMGMTRCQYWSQRFGNFWKRCSFSLTFLSIIILNLWLLVHACSARGIDVIEQLTSDNYQKIDPWLVFSVIGLIASIFAMINLKLSIPGYLEKEGTVLKQLSREFDTRPVKCLTPLDDICFSCLRLKLHHEEHCNQCNRCVAYFHLHSEYFDKCIGREN
jgi:hypothetical protein